MEIVVCVKQVPETSEKKEFGPDFRMNRANLDSVINPFDEYAIEEALRLKEAHGGEVIVLTMGPASAEDTMRKALAMGADRGVLVSDPGLGGTDAWGTAYVLAQALRQIEYTLVITGMESTDARTGLVPGGLAEQLGVPLLTYATKVEVDGEGVTINRQVPGGYQVIEASLPSVVSVVKGVNEPRYPSLKGIMAAKRKEIKKLDLAALEITADDVGLQGSKTRVLAAAPRTERSGGETIQPENAQEAAKQIADWLQARKFI